MKLKVFLFPVMLCCLSCSNDNSTKETDALDGVYINEYNSSCLIINEYEEGKLGYYVFDHRKGFENFSREYAMGTISVKIDNSDSIAIFKVLKKNMKKETALPYSINSSPKISKAQGYISFNFGKNPINGKESITNWGKMKETNTVKEIKDAVKASMRVTFSNK